MSVDYRGTLARLGLPPGEIEAYITLLACGELTVHTLARHTGSSRQVTYETLRCLESRGLVVKKTDGEKKRWTFSAEDPERLDVYFSHRLQLFSAELDALRRVTPELRVMQKNHGCRPRIRVLSGYEAMGELFSDVERVAPRDLFEFSDLDAVAKNIDIQRMKSLKKVLNYDRLRAKLLFRGDGKYLNLPTIEARLVDSPPFDSDVWIYANRTCLVRFEDGDIHVIIIDDDALTQAMKGLFMLAWNAATPYTIST